MARTRIGGKQITDGTVNGDDIDTASDVQVATLAIGSTANSTAALTVTATDKGILLPRMTPVQRDAISSPPAGLLVYDSTNNEMNYYNGSAWKKMDGTAAGTGCENVTLYGQSSGVGYSSVMEACNGSGTTHSLYHEGGSQVYSDSGCSSALSLSAGGYFYRMISSSKYYYYITSGGIVKTGQYGSTTTLDTTSGQGCG